MKTHREKGYHCACLFCDSPKDSEYHRNVVANTNAILDNIHQRTTREAYGIILSVVVGLISLAWFLL